MINKFTNIYTFFFIRDITFFFCCIFSVKNFYRLS